MKKLKNYCFMVLVLCIMITAACKSRPEYEVQMIDDKYRTYYEVFLYSFCDGDGDGTGDIKGLISKLDYIADLGFNGIWLMPIMPSPTYHKYDSTDYYSIDPEYGTMEDFKELIDECNNKGIRVIIDLAVNHTSNQHPWFRSAIESLPIEPCGMEECIHEELCREHNPYCGFYYFVDGFHTGYTALSSGWYYESVFWSGMPDIRLENPQVRTEFEKIIKFWLDLGVSGFRLDAAKEYYTGNSEKNIEVLTWINDYVKGFSEDYYIVAEVWDTPAVYKEYYESGIDSVFDFAFADGSGKIVKTINLKGSANSAESFGNFMVFMQEQIKEVNEEAVDAPFFTNHDTGRMAGFLGQDDRKMKMASAMNLLMTGNVFVYYGEEIGMSGSGRDENKRAPMLWISEDSGEGTGIGMTKGPAEMETVVSSFPPAEEQKEDPYSIYNYYKNAIRLRNTFPAIARGIVAADDEIQNNEICAVSKEYGEEKLLIVYNISEEAQEVNINKEKYKNAELGGQLSVDKNKVVFKNGTLKLPSYGIAVIVY